MAPLAGIYEDKPPQVTDQGVLDAHSIGRIDPAHGQYGNDVNETWPSAFGIGYQATAYGPNVNTGVYDPYNEPGEALDSTPSTHSAPFPKGIIQPNLEDTGSYADTARIVQEQRSLVHRVGLGAARILNRNSPAGKEIPTHTTVDRYDAPNVNSLAPVPGQVKHGMGGVSKDTSQGYGQLNSTEEFQRGHSIRIVQHDRMPWDRSLDYAPPQPFWGRHEINQATFDGPDSPYGAAGDTTTGQQVVLEGRIGNPTAYVQSPEVTVNQPAPNDGSGEVWAYYG